MGSIEPSSSNYSQFRMRTGALIIGSVLQGIPSISTELIFIGREPVFLKTSILEWLLRIFRCL